jgi:hypothetical protein
MSLPEFVTPVLSVAGPAALVFVIMRYFPHAARAVMMLLAGIVAIVTRDPERRAASHKVLDTLTRLDDKPQPPEISASTPRNRQGRVKPSKETKG